VATLVLFTVAVPIFLLRQAGRAVASRDVSLQLRFADMSRCFDELDAGPAPATFCF
jgi:hypothetical protein